MSTLAEMLAGGRGAGALYESLGLPERRKRPRFKLWDDADDPTVEDLQAQLLERVRTAPPESIRESPHGALQTALEILDLPRNAIANLVNTAFGIGAKPSSKLTFAGLPKISAGDILGRLGWEPTSTAGKVARGVVGFLGDVATDPLTWITGPGRLLGGTATKIAGKSFTPAGVKAVEQAATKLGPTTRLAQLGEGFKREAVGQRLAAQAPVTGTAGGQAAHDVLDASMRRELAAGAVAKQSPELLDDTLIGLSTRPMREFNPLDLPAMLATGAAGMLGGAKAVGAVSRFYEPIRRATQVALNPLSLLPAADATLLRRSSAAGQAVSGAFGAAGRAIGGALARVPGSAQIARGGEEIGRSLWRKFSTEPVPARKGDTADWERWRAEKLKQEMDRGAAVAANRKTIEQYEAITEQIGSAAKRIGLPAKLVRESLYPYIESLGPAGIGRMVRADVAREIARTVEAGGGTAEQAAKLARFIETPTPGVAVSLAPEGADPKVLAGFHDALRSELMVKDGSQIKALKALGLPHTVELTPGGVGFQVRFDPAVAPESAIAAGKALRGVLGPEAVTLETPGGAVAAVAGGGVQATPAGVKWLEREIGGPVRRVYGDYAREHDWPPLPEGADFGSLARPSVSLEQTQFERAGSDSLRQMLLRVMPDLDADAGYPAVLHALRTEFGDTAIRDAVAGKPFKKSTSAGRREIMQARDELARQLSGGELNLYPQARRGDKIEIRDATGAAHEAEVDIVDAATLRGDFAFAEGEEIKLAPTGGRDVQDAQQRTGRMVRFRPDARRMLELSDDPGIGPPLIAAAEEGGERVVRGSVQIAAMQKWSAAKWEWWRKRVADRYGAIPPGVTRPVVVRRVGAAPDEALDRPWLAAIENPGVRATESREQWLAAMRDVAAYRKQRGYTSRTDPGVLAADVQLAELNAAKDAAHRRWAASETRVENVNARARGQRALAAGIVTPEAIVHAPLSELPTELADVMRAEARTLLKQEPAEATATALRAIAAGVGDTGQVVARQKERIVGILSGRIDQRTIFEKQMGQPPRPPDPVVEKWLAPPSQRRETPFEPPDAVRLEELTRTGRETPQSRAKAVLRGLGHADLDELPPIDWRGAEDVTEATVGEFLRRNTLLDEWIRARLSPERAAELTAGELAERVDAVRTLTLGPKPEPVAPPAAVLPGERGELEVAPELRRIAELVQTAQHETLARTAAAGLPAPELATQRGITYLKRILGDSDTVIGRALRQAGMSLRSGAMKMRTFEREKLVSEINREVDAINAFQMGKGQGDAGTLKAVELLGLQPGETLPLYEADALLSHLSRELEAERVIGSADWLREISQRFGVRVNRGDDIPQGYMRAEAKRFGDVTREYVYRPEVAALIERHVGQWAEPAPILNAWRTVQGLWKGVVLMTPGYHVANLFGNIWNAHLLDGWSLSGFAIGRETALAAARGDAKKLARKAVGELTHGELYRRALADGVIGRGMYAQEIRANPDAVRALIESLETPAAAGSAWKKLRGGHPIEANRVIGQTVEDGTKLGVIVTRMNKGDTYEQAAAKAREALFDYTDLTTFEKGTPTQMGVRDVIPFYAFAKFNARLLLRIALTNPRKLAEIPKIQLNVEREAAGEDILPPSLRPAHVLKEGGVQITGGTNPVFLDLGRMLPFGGLRSINPLAPVQAARSVFEQVGPAKIPFELGANYNAYFDEPIRQYAEQMKELLGIPIAPELKHVARAITPLNQVEQLTRIASTAPTASQAIGLSAAKLGGVRLMPADVGRQAFEAERGVNDQLGAVRRDMRRRIAEVQRGGGDPAADGELARLAGIHEELRAQREAIPADTARKLADTLSPGRRQKLDSLLATYREQGAGNGG